MAKLRFVGPLFGKKGGKQKQKSCGKMNEINMALYLGIDSGGTKTDCAVSNGAEILGQASGPSSKAARVGCEQARRNLQSVVKQACTAGNVDPAKILHVCIGMAGASLPDAVTWVQQSIREVIPAA